LNLAGLGDAVMMPELLLTPFTKGKEVSSGVLSGIDTGTETDRQSNPEQRD